MALAVPASAAELNFTGNVYYANEYQLSQLPTSTGTSLKMDEFKFGFLLYLPQHIQSGYTYIIEANISLNSQSMRNPFTNDIYSISTHSSRPSVLPTSGNLTNNATVQTNSTALNTKYYITFNSNDITNPESVLYFSLFSNNNITDQTLYPISLSSFTGYIVYDPNEQVIDIINNKIDLLLDSSSDINSNLETIINQTNTIINNSNTIINNQTEINNNIVKIFEYGNNYEQINNSLINNLGSAEDQLSFAEDALENKSSSLRNSVSSQWQQSTQTARSFVNTITPATAAITNTVTSVVTAMPSEAQTLLTVLPLLLFIGWLIGRVGGG